MRSVVIKAFNIFKASQKLLHKEIFELNVIWKSGPPSSFVQQLSNISISILTPKWKDLQGIVTTFAGSGSQNFADGERGKESFYHPRGITVDADENLFVADQHNHRIRKISKEGIVTTIAGNSNPLGNEDGKGTLATFRHPAGIVSDIEGNLFVTDLGKHRIRKITKEGVVSTIAGSSRGYANGMGTEAMFNHPYRIIIDLNKNLFVTDYYNHRIRKISPSGMVNTFAGSGIRGDLDGVNLHAQFNCPRGIATDPLGNIYVSDDHRIRKISPQGSVTTIAGSSQRGKLDGVGSSAQFSYPDGIAIDCMGNLFVSDRGNHRIRKVSEKGEVTTLAGSTEGFADGRGSRAQFANPIGIVIDGKGDVFVCDFANHLIRKIM